MFVTVPIDRPLTGLIFMTECKAPKPVSHDAAIANLSSLGILLVVLGHSSPTRLAVVETSSELVFREVLTVISLFHMPLFFFISGYLMAHSLAADPGRKLNFSRFVIGKAKRLLLPYWAISTCAFPLKTLMSGEAIRPLDFSLKDYVISLVMPWQNTIIFFWFLPTLFLVFLAAPILLKAVNSSSLALRIGLTIGLAIPSLVITPVFWMDPLNYRGAAAHLGTFWLGMLWRSRGPVLTPLGNAWLGGSAALVFATLVLANYARVTPESPLFQAAIHLALAWTGVATSYGFVQLATRLGLTHVPWIDGRSYQIYLLSWFPQMFVKIAIFRWMGLGFWPSAGLMFVSGLLVPVAVARLVERRFPQLKPYLGM